MSRPRVIVGADDRGRPKAQWADPGPAEAPAYGFMQPAYDATSITRRQATPDELAAARAREAEPSHLTTDNARSLPFGAASPGGPTNAERLQASRQRGAERHVEVITARRAPAPNPEPEPEDEPAVPEPKPLDTFEELAEAAAKASEAWARRQAAEIAWMIAQEALEAVLGEVDAILHPPLVVRKMSATLPIDVEEARLNELSDLAIGKAIGGQLGDALVSKAEANLEVLGRPDEPAPTAPEPAIHPSAKYGRAKLYPGQQRILDAVIAHDADRKAAAKALGTSDNLVDATLRQIGKKGLLPADLIPKLPAAFAKYVGA